jgi:phenylacetate-CoA ligase
MSMDVSKKPTVALSDRERFPLISDLTWLNTLRQDAVAPHFNFQSGDRLNRRHLDLVHQYSTQIREGKFWGEEAPGWLQRYVEWCRATVPFYKERSNEFHAQPTIRRRDIQLNPWLFVSSECDLDDLLVYQTSGTTGPAMDVLFDPVSQACWLPQLESVLLRHGLGLSRGKGLTSIALICHQENTLTYASLSTYLEGAGILKINLHESNWKSANHRAQYLEKYNPEVLTGDPFAFLSLLTLGPKLSPKAMVSSAMKLTSALQKSLEEQFRCPVFDVYSLTECRMIAVAEGLSRYRAIRPELFFEVFDPHEDRSLPPGARGELVITGGNNPFLPLIRYRTGDHCSLTFSDGVPYLNDLEGRETVPFYRMDNSFVNNVDISRTMSAFSLAAFHVHQNNDKSILVRICTNEKEIAPLIQDKLMDIFGRDMQVRVIHEDTNGKKLVNYTSDVS